MCVYIFLRAQGLRARVVSRPLVWLIKTLLFPVLLQMPYGGLHPTNKAADELYTEAEHYSWRDEQGAADGDIGRDRRCVTR